MTAKVSLSPELRRTKEPHNLSVRSDTAPSPTPTEISRNAANHLSCPDLETMVARAGGLQAVAGANLSGGIPNRALEILERNNSGNHSTPHSKPITSSPLALSCV